MVNVGKPSDKQCIWEWKEETVNSAVKILIETEIHLNWIQATWKKIKVFEYKSVG